MPDPLRLIGAEGSYYTAKVRAYLRWKRLPFEWIVATRQVYATHEVFRSGIRSLPVLSTGDQTVCDSTDIVDWLETRFPEPSAYPTTPLQRLVAMAFEVYADEWLFGLAMHLRWSFPRANREFVLHDQGATLLPNASMAMQRHAGEAAERRALATLPLLGITGESAPALDRWYEEIIDRLERHLGCEPCLLGSRPSIGDFALMGLLHAHGCREPHASEILRRRGPRVGAWVEMIHGGSVFGGAFLPDDVVPETTSVLLQRFFTEHLPVLLDTVTRLEAWVATNPGMPVPRFIGRHEVSIGGVRVTRAVMPYAVSMLQRLVDHLAGISGTERERVRTWLAAQGGDALLDVRIHRRLRRVDNVLELTDEDP